MFQTAGFERTFLTVLALGLLVGDSGAASARDRLSSKDRYFLAEAIQGDLAEVNMGRLAQQKGRTSQVRQFGKTLEQDHSAHLQKTQQLAERNGLVPPTAPNAKQRAMHERMKELSGTRFDIAFARDMVNDHEKDIRKYQKQARSGSPLSGFARQTVPALEKHLEMAKSLPSGPR
jgi:putative membrane protein